MNLNLSIYIQIRCTNLNIDRVRWLNFTMQLIRLSTLVNLDTLLYMLVKRFLFELSYVDKVRRSG